MPGVMMVPSGNCRFMQLRLCTFILTNPTLRARMRSGLNWLETFAIGACAAACMNAPDRGLSPTRKGQRVGLQLFSGRAGPAVAGQPVASVRAEVAFQRPLERV